ncbi:MAG: ATP-binding protein, partial [Planctomycetota bacterium]
LRETIARVIDSDERHEFPSLAARLPNGEEREVDVHLSPVARRTQRRALVFINDITERRRAEDEVRREKQKLDNIVSAMGAGLMLIEPDFTISWSNPTSDAWFGDGESLVGSICHGICPRFHTRTAEMAAPCEDCVVVRVLETGEVLTVPQVVMGGQQPVRHYQNILAPIRDEDGEIVQVIRVTFDVTEHARKVEQVSLLQKLSEAMQGTLELDRLLHLILTCVTAGPGLGFNRAVLLLVDDSHTVLEGRLGVGPSSLEEAARIWRELSERPQNLGRLLERFDEPVPPGDQSMQYISQQIRIPLDATNEAPVRSVREKRPIVVNDAEHDFQVSPALRDLLGVGQFVVVPLVARDEALGALIADNIYTRRPISDADVEMLRTFAAHAGMAISAASAYKKLEDQVVQLEEAQDQLVRSERLATVGKLAAHVAHEIRNPLATIGGFTRSILRSPRNVTKVRRNANIILDEVVRLEHILANVMNFTKPGEPILRQREINEFADAVCAFHETDCAEQGVTLHRSFDPACPPLHFDPDQIRQVLINLIQNALDAMPEGGELTVMTRLQDRFVEVVVADTGVGMTEEVVEALFEPFFTTKVGGTGLGLSVSQKIAHSHGGDILVQSKPGAGSSFTLRLPVSRSDTA